jgi:NADH-quinone oxidoreductase subunit J
MIASLVFYLFSFVLITSAVMVVAARNPVHAVLFLILCFFNAAGLFLLLGAELVAFVLIIVYVGAVAVLFLFVVMMLDINFQELRKGFQRYLPVGGTVALVFLAQLVFVASAWVVDPHALTAVDATVGAVENTRAIGRVLYTDYFYPFQVSGLVLLVAMTGAIVLTLRDRKGSSLRQNAARQVDRPVSEIIEIRKVPVGQGVDV